MTQFRPGQRVRVVGHAPEWEGCILLLPIGSYWHVDEIGCIGRFRGEWGVNSPAPAHFLAEPGIPAHLVRTDTDPASRHWPVWRA